MKLQISKYLHCHQISEDAMNYCIQMAYQDPKPPHLPERLVQYISQYTYFLISIYEQQFSLLTILKQPQIL